MRKSDFDILGNAPQRVALSIDRKCTGVFSLTQDLGMLGYGQGSAQSTLPRDKSRPTLVGADRYLALFPGNLPPLSPSSSRGLAARKSLSRSFSIGFSHGTVKVSPILFPVRLGGS